MSPMSRLHRVVFAAAVLVWLVALWLMGTDDRSAEYQPAIAPGVEPAPYNAEGGAP